MCISTYENVRLFLIENIKSDAFGAIGASYEFVPIQMEFCWSGAAILAWEQS